ncbi:MAG TPA: agmatinase [Candidatus Gastranaerophilales bacterium]|nr:agmatinase [Candidatus Gastranaerophilales bacterium]
MSKNWMGSVESFNEADCIMVGLPYDGTCSFRPGARFAPQEIRLASYGIETYSPVFDKDLSEIKFYDAGDIEFEFGDREDSLFKIERAAKETYLQNKKWLGIGGEHLVTFPAVKACLEKYPDLNIIHFDAHTDLINAYLNQKLSHAAVMRRILELISPENLIQTGIRSGTKEEFEWIKENKTLFNDEESFAERIAKLNNKPVYLSVDLDVLDPSIFCGTGTPEPGGLTFNELIDRLHLLKNLNIVGADVVELSPHYDMSGVSTITAAKVIREVLFLS